MDCSTPGFSVLHHLPEFAQTHVHQVGDAIQPSHPLSSPFPPAFNLSQHQGLFQRVGSSHQVAKVLELYVFGNSISTVLSRMQLGWPHATSAHGFSSELCIVLCPPLPQDTVHTSLPLSTCLPDNLSRNVTSETTARLYPHAYF